MKQSINTFRHRVNQVKKAVLATALFLTLGVGYSFAAGKEKSAGGGAHTTIAPTNDIASAAASDKISSLIRVSFHKDFANAQIISAEALPKFTKLTFTMNNAVFFAYYAGTGDLLAVTRNILSSQLPMTLQLALRDSYANYWISELFEISCGEQNGYYVTVESADQTLTLRSTGDNTWEVYEKTKKN